MRLTGLTGLITVVEARGRRDPAVVRGSHGTEDRLEPAEGKGSPLWVSNRLLTLRDPAV